MSPAALMNVHQKAIQEAVIKVSGLCSFRLLSVRMRVGSCSAVCDKPRHWWRKQRGPHTLRPISMVQHIKLSFSDKTHSGLLLVRLVLQQVVAEWEMASLCLNHRSTYLLSTWSCSVAWSLSIKYRKGRTYHKILTGTLAIIRRKVQYAAEHCDCIFLLHVSPPGNVNLLHTFWFLCW